MGNWFFISFPFCAFWVVYLIYILFLNVKGVGEDKIDLSFKGFWYIFIGILQTKIGSCDIFAQFVSHKNLS